MKRKGNQRDNFVNQWLQAEDDYRHPVDQPSVSLIMEWALMWVYRVSHCPTFSVNSLWIIGVCYRGILVSVGQSHDISLWSILSLGNWSINVEMIYKLPSLWYQLMSHYTDNLCANFEEAPGRAHKRIRYVCLTMSLHWFRLWLGAAYTTHYCLNKWWHKPTMYVCVTWP